MKNNIRFAKVLFVSVAILLGGVAGGAERLALRVSAPGDCVDVPVHVSIELPRGLADVPLEEIGVGLRQADTGQVVPGQLVKTDEGKAELWWILPQAKASTPSAWVATLGKKSKADWDVFSWKDNKGQYLDLLFGGRKVTRYMYAYDTSTKQRTFETYKPFHHVFDASGNLLTNGPDGLHPYLKDKIRYPHHRGIFVGWNKLAFGGQQYDLWHMKGVHQVHQRFLELTAGPVMARSSARIYWNDKNGEPIIAEQRQTTVFRQGDPTVLLMDFQTELKAVRDDVFLNGDPEHAGFQYRAHNDVNAGGEDVKATYLFHTNGINPKKDHDLPWAAMSYGLSSGRYSVQHMNHPDNPKPTVYSAYRDYGRFGAFFKKEIGAGRTLMLRYRIWVGQGRMPKRREPANRCSAFVNAPEVEVLRR
jgi:hypothetical protein